MHNRKAVIPEQWTNWFGSIFVGFALPIIIFKALKWVWSKKFGFDLNGKVVIITGASSGLGEALAHQLYKSGCRVVLCARRKEELERVRSDLLRTHSPNPTALPVVIPMDIADIGSLKEIVDKIVDITGTIDILVNNAGIAYRGSVVETEPHVDENVMKVNYLGTAALTKAVLPTMLKHSSGHIVFVNSVQGAIAIPFRSAYAASKYALRAFADSLRAEVATENIQVLTVLPGYIRTALSINAVTACGKSYGKMDQSTENGYAPEYVARIIVQSVKRDEKEITLSTLMPKVAIFLRSNLPSLYFYVMMRRAHTDQEH